MQMSIQVGLKLCRLLFTLIVIDSLLYEWYKGDNKYGKSQFVLILDHKALHA